MVRRSRPERVLLPLALLALASIGGSVYLAWRGYERANQEAILSREILDHTTRLLRSLVDAETGERGFLLTGDAQYLEPFSRGARRASVELSQLKNYGGRRAELKDELAGIQASIAAVLSEMETAIHARETEGAAAALDLMRNGAAKRTMDRIRELCASITETETDRWRTESSRRYEEGERMLLVTTIGGAGLFLLLASSMGLIHKATSRREHLIAKFHERGELLGTTLGSVADGVIATDASGRVTFLNGVAQELTGWSRKEAVGQPIETVFRLFHEHTRESVESPAYRVLREGKSSGLASDTALVRRDGTEIPVADSAAPIRARDGSMLGVVMVFRDITAERRAAEEKRLLDERLQQSAKLESLGVLAGGIAHDFNNLLVGIIGNASIVLDQLPPGSDTRPMLQQVIASGEKAAVLVRQMLAFAGKGRFVIERVNLVELVRDAAPLLEASFPRNVQLSLELRDAPPVEGDAAQMRQLVTNLVLNAAEACGEREGEVAIAVYAREVGAEDVAALHAATPIAPGRRVCLEVRDTGEGMDSATMARIFDPFFTTKFTGRGLGLPAVLGIVRGHNGALQVSSAPGQGTMFRVLLPVAADSGEAQRPSRGMVLLVESETDVRKMARFALERAGYSVLPAADFQSALQIVKRERSGFRALVVDVSDPEAAPGRLVAELRRISAGLPVVVTTGFGEPEVRQWLGGVSIAGFVQKPYTPEALCRAVRAAA